MEAISVTLAQVALNLNAALRGVPEALLWKMPVNAEFDPGKEAPLAWLASHPSTGFAISITAADFQHRSGEWTLLRLHGASVEAWSMSYELVEVRRGWLRSPSAHRGTWRARFQRRDVSPLLPDQTLSDARLGLETTLHEILVYVARRQPGWAQAFKSVQSLLADEGDAGQALLGGELLLSTQARTTIAAVLQAQFFSGMGNWADNIADAEGVALTQRLYCALSHALVAAVNTSAQSPDH